MVEWEGFVYGEVLSVKRGIGSGKFILDKEISFYRFYLVDERKFCKFIGDLGFFRC